MLSISTEYLIKEAKKRKYKINIIDESINLYTIKSNDKEIVFKNIDGGINSSLGQKFARNKDLTYKILKHLQIPYPKSVSMNHKKFKDIDLIIKKLGFPLVVKPTNTNHGTGITMNVISKEQLLEGINYGFKYGKNILIQKQLLGYDHRLLVVGDEMVAGIKKKPCMIIGNGRDSIEELINKENENINRGEIISNGQSLIYTKPLVKIQIDEQLISYINYTYNYSINSILKDKEKIYLRGNSNISKGGTYKDITKFVHPNTKKYCIELSSYLGLKVCGIDIVSEDISQDINNGNSGIIEINSTPGIDMHDNGLFGKNRNVCKKILDLYFS